MHVDAENGTILEIKEIIKENEHLLPICLQYDSSLKAVNDWMGTRKIPDKREGLKRARQTFRGFENYYNMFSLSDQYWLQFKKSETWEKLNFFTNSYGKEKGQIFFLFCLPDIKIAVKSPSPDLTTNGVLKKCWIQDEEKNSYLLKAGSVKYHQEPLSEVLASITLRKIDIIPFIEYELVIHGLQFCSKCPNFVTANTEFVPASHIYKKKKRKMDERVFDHFLQMCDEYNIIGAEDYMTKMIAADHILCNSDRHLGNFGFIRDAETGKILGFAPLFDFGRAYWGAKPAVHDKMENTSRFFSDVEDKCFKKALRYISVEEVVDTLKLEKMVERYPEIDGKQIEEIKGRIHGINKELINEKIPKKKVEKGVAK